MNAVPASTAPHMNAVPYHVSNPSPGHADHRFGFRNSSAYFEVYSPWIESRYSEVVWRTLDAVPFTIVVGFRVDIVVAGTTRWELTIHRPIPTNHFFGYSAPRPRLSAPRETHRA